MTKIVENQSLKAKRQATMTEEKPITRYRTTFFIPRKIKTEKQLITLFENYLDTCFITDVDIKGREYQRNIKPLSKLGFANYCNINREYLKDRKREGKFVEAIDYIFNFIEEWVEGQLYTNNRTVGVIFSLKNCFSTHWKDQTEQKIDVKSSNIKFEFGDEQSTDNNI